MKTIKRLLGTILILLTVVFQSKSQDVVVNPITKSFTGKTVVLRLS
ncbi:MAG: hypothetical protein ACJA08_003231 [Cyclobacteriaceae bacterium]|jgi:hypothetical protein